MIQKAAGQFTLYSSKYQPSLPIPNITKPSSGPSITMMSNISIDLQRVHYPESITWAFCIDFFETLLSEALLTEPDRLPGALTLLVLLMLQLPCTQISSTSCFFLRTPNIFTGIQAHGKLLYKLRDLLALKWVPSFPTYHPGTKAGTDGHQGCQQTHRLSSRLDPPTLILMPHYLQRSTCTDELKQAETKCACPKVTFPGGRKGHQPVSLRSYIKCQNRNFEGAGGNTSTDSGCTSYTLPSAPRPGEALAAAMD